MAGMLPGVEAARRRRFHKSNLISYGSDLSPNTSAATFTRRSSFCLYAPTHDFHSNSNSLRNPGGSLQQVCDESRLGAAAREAKKRLDERLQQQWRSVQTNRIESTTPSFRHGSGSVEDRPIVQSNLRTEAPKLKKNGSKKLNWLKLSWKSSEQEECAVCLEQFKDGQGRGAGRGRGRGHGETLMQLHCGHRFHTSCLVPWLEAKGHCPCCRMEIPSS
ncbi:probable E3 ubiquitin-protein ligase RHY1A [Sesamum indicum]|uniref:Probable E3 ubiquitin-protein ligase RHY1A n=1 Tax=Sesamum indicum TaxID=4182 RepID=A0A6I9T465_SESIN|nr:probable E3 ubiquitin-protein ligase RHY1A [Sesamum indicum]